MLRRSILAKFEKKVYNSLSNGICSRIEKALDLSYFDYKIALIGWGEGLHAFRAEHPVGTLRHDHVLWKDTVTYGAVTGGHYKLVKALIIYNSPHMSRFLAEAARCGHLRMIKYLRHIWHMHNTRIPSDDCFIHAAAGGQLRAMILVMKWGIADAYLSVSNAASTGKVKALKFIKRRCIEKIDWGSGGLSDRLLLALRSAIANDRVCSVRYLSKWLWQTFRRRYSYKEIAALAARVDSPKVEKWALSHG